MSLVTRRAMLAGAGAALVAGPAAARISPTSLKPLIGPGYRPVDTDEKGLWQQMERVEEEVAGSNLLIRDPALNAYLQGLIGKVGGPAAKDMRIYLARVPEFNAMMFPTGFTVFFSGLLLRMRDEAQLAGVIAHESSHFLLKHQIRSWRDMKRKTNIFAGLAMAAGLAGGATGTYTGDLVRLAELGTMLTLFRYSRQLEAESDALGLRLIAEAGYSPLSMSETWDQLITELEWSARERDKRVDRGFSLFATHPAPRERLKDLKASAEEFTLASRTYERGRERYLAAMSSLRPTLFDDQVKLNDPGASTYIVDTLAKDGWNGQLLFTRGEIDRLRNHPERQKLAAVWYERAVAYPDAPADAWRWHGVMLMKQGRSQEGRTALQRYLAMAPNAPDAPFVRQMIVG
ncbi:M48 family metallopeptidase [Sphingomonas sp. LHG3406-1]|uniref:M48 family metallopeptidase n=1 Tax=Sphingomonas sp. LHG3406-1 TaxID=2804617 RepID=UPI00260F7A0D|nr:M48 family metallopeptidase [Sphingomonas sp. LHG3406-1]